MSEPIWKDYYVDLGTDSQVNFRIRLGGASGDIIYTGRAYKRPGETHNNIKINDICADYLQNVLPTLSNAEFSELSFPLTFLVQKNASGSTWSSVKSVSFRPDWSYNYDYNPATMGMSFPVNRHLDSKQFLLVSAIDASTISVRFTYEDGSSSVMIIPLEITEDFDASFNEDFSRSLRGAGSGTATIDLSRKTGLAGVQVGSETWEVVGSCNRYILYYTNAFGGWDQFLIEGFVQEHDALTRHEQSVEYDNRDIQNRGISNYVNEIEKSWTLNTLIMTDEESLRMHHLLNSTDVYLYDMMDKKMIPVTIKNTTTDYKTYKSNSHRMASYTIEVALAQTRLRR